LAEAVDAAVDAYSGVATFEIESDEREIVVQVEADAGYGDVVYHAFCNHVLFESIVRSRQALGGRLT